MRRPCDQSEEIKGRGGGEGQRGSSVCLKCEGIPVGRAAGAL